MVLAFFGLMITLICACFDSMVIAGCGVALGAIMAAPAIIREARS